MKNKKLDDEPLDLGKAQVNTPNNSVNNRSKLFIILAILGFVGITVIAYFIVNISKKSLLPSNNTAQEMNHKNSDAKNLDHDYYAELDKIIVPLVSVNGKNTNIALKISLRLQQEKHSAIINSKMPMIRDQILGFLTSLRSADFNTSYGMLMMKEGLTKRINEVLAPVFIKELLIQEFLID